MIATGALIPEIAATVPIGGMHLTSCFQWK